MTDKETQGNAPQCDLSEEPLTREEIEHTIHERVSRITGEFKDGLDLISKYPKSVTIFGSARFKADNPYYIKAQSLTKRISEELGHAVVTGGGPGIMEAGNRGAHDANGESLGLTIRLPMEQTTNPYLTDTIDFYYFFSRKVVLSFAAEAYIFFPGGFGTMDEFFEILTLVQTQKIACMVPIILVGEAYWKPLDEFIQKVLLEKFGTISDTDTKLYTITDSEDEVLEIVRNAPMRY